MKEKRAVVKPILEGARRRYQVSAAEVAHQDRWQRAVLGFALVGADAGHLEEVMAAVERFVWSFPEAEVLDAGRGFAPVDDDG
ncbi:MAG: DUF503 domain-containing protein [Acidimicrobiales bacterium]